MRRNVILLVLMFLLFACSIDRGGPVSVAQTEGTPAPTGYDSLANVQIIGETPLPPYGLRVRADVAELQIQVRSSKESVTDRLNELEQTLAQLEALAAQDEAIRLTAVSLGQVGSDYERGALLDSSRSLMDSSRGNSSALTMRLESNLQPQSLSLLDSLAQFNQFLAGLSLSDTLELNILTVQSRISQPESYRSQLIAQVYQELAGIEGQYGPDVAFDVRELHGPLLSRPLSDVEYYLYLEPVISVTEF